MSAQTHDEYRLKNTGLLPNAWKVAAGLSAVGLVLTAVGFDAHRIGYSYLFGFFATLTVLFGAMFHVIAQNVTRGHWSVTTRRIAELLLSGAPVLLVAGLLLVGGVASGKFDMYQEWTSVAAHGGGHGEGHGEGGDAHAAAGHEEHAAGGHASAYPPAPEHTPQMARLHHEVLQHKSGYLSMTGWMGRSVGYLAVWGFICWFFWSNSRKQDETKDLALTNKMNGLAPLLAFLGGLSLTFASFDWVMALQPAWYSTIFGVIMFGGSAMTIFALIVLFSISLHEGGHVGDAINVEHIHDNAKLMFGFMCFWTYTSFSQWMLIWYAGIPEESVFFQARWTGGWEVISKVLPICHFGLPFVIFISREVKRRLWAIKLVASWLLVFHVVDIFWYVMPTAAPHFAVSPADIGCLLLIGGAFFALVLKNMGQVPLIPVGDPRLARSLHHHQTH